MILSPTPKLRRYNLVAARSERPGMHQTSSEQPPARISHTCSAAAAGIAVRVALAVALAWQLGDSPAAAACTTVDPTHRAWSEIVARRVVDGRVDYAGIRRDDEAALNAYLTTLSGACGEDYAAWPQTDKLAFWLNAYNAYTVRLILDHYPLGSIRDIGWLPGAAFRMNFIPMIGLRGELISLDDIEHRVLRAHFNEPRIHFALVCAARSCPPLREEAYQGAIIDRQLDLQGRRFLADADKNRVDPAARTLYLSRIFKWFSADFTRNGALISFVAPYLELAPADGAGFSIKYLPYDWSLNE